MTAPAHPRLLPSNGRVAHVSLNGLGAELRLVEGMRMQIARPLADLCRSPGGARDRQLLMGTGFLLLERTADHAFGQSALDGYCGWVAAGALGPWSQPTHAVAAAATHLYPDPDLHAREVARLSFGAELRIAGSEGAFARTDTGLYVPEAHLRPRARMFHDPVAVARLFLGTPYLWGGNSRDGIDCSGLVQAAFRACGHDCPPDSDMQACWGTALAPDAAPRRGDLIFWRGHVALATGAAGIIHANAHHMAVTQEPLATATARIAASGGGPVIARRRPPRARRRPGAHGGQSSLAS